MENKIQNKKARNLNLFLILGIGLLILSLVSAGIITNNGMLTNELGSEEQTISPSYNNRISDIDNIKNKKEKAQSFLFLKSDQTKSNFDFNSPKSALILLKPLLMAFNSDLTPLTSKIMIEKPIDINKAMSSNVGDFNTPITIKNNKIIPAIANPQPTILSKISNLLFIYLPPFWSLSAIKPTIIPAITPNNALNSSVKLKPRFSNKITIITTNTPDKTDLVSFDNINKDYLDNYLKLSEKKNEI